MVLELNGKQDGWSSGPANPQFAGRSLCCRPMDSLSLDHLEQNQSRMSDETWTVHRSSEAFFSPLQSAIWLGRPATLRVLLGAEWLGNKRLEKRSQQKRFRHCVAKLPVPVRWPLRLRCPGADLGQTRERALAGALRGRLRLTITLPHRRGSSLELCGQRR